MTEMIFFWLALGCYVISGAVYMSVFALRWKRLSTAGIILAASGLLFHTVSLGIRWSMAGHGPYMSTFEILSSTVWTAILLFLFLEFRIKGFAALGAAVMPLSFIMMGFALLGSREAKTLPPSLRSSWLVVHVIFAKLTIAAILIATALAVFYLLKKAYEPETGFLARLPSVAKLDDLSYRLVAFGFIALTIMVITGAIWANNAWGSYWSWDPTQTWSLVLWFIYGIYLHGRITFRWQGSISAWYIIFAFAVSLMTFFILPYFIKSLHAKYMIG